MASNVPPPNQLLGHLDLTRCLLGAARIYASIISHLLKDASEFNTSILDYNKQQELINDAIKNTLHDIDNDTDDIQSHNRRTNLLVGGDTPSRKRKARPLAGGGGAGGAGSTNTIQDTIPEGLYDPDNVSTDHIMAQPPMSQVDLLRALNHGMNQFDDNEIDRFVKEQGLLPQIIDARPEDIARIVDDQFMFDFGTDDNNNNYEFINEGHQSPLDTFAVRDTSRIAGLGVFSPLDTQQIWSHKDNRQPSPFMGPGQLDFEMSSDDEGGSGSLRDRTPANRRSMAGSRLTTPAIDSRALGDTGTAHDLVLLHHDPQAFMTALYDTTQYDQQEPSPSATQQPSPTGIGIGGGGGGDTTQPDGTTIHAAAAQRPQRQAPAQRQARPIRPSNVKFTIDDNISASSRPSLPPGLIDMLNAYDQSVSAPPALGVLHEQLRNILPQAEMSASDSDMTQQQQQQQQRYRHSTSDLPAVGADHPDYDDIYANRSAIDNDILLNASLSLLGLSMPSLSLSFGGPRSDTVGGVAGGLISSHINVMDSSTRAPMTLSRDAPLNLTFTKPTAATAVSTIAPAAAHISFESMDSFSLVDPSSSSFLSNMDNMEVINTTAQSYLSSLQLQPPTKRLYQHDERATSATTTTDDITVQPNLSVLSSKHSMISALTSSSSVSALGPSLRTSINHTLTRSVPHYNHTDNIVPLALPIIPTKSTRSTGAAATSSSTAAAAANARRISLIPQTTPSPATAGLLSLLLSRPSLGSTTSSSDTTRASSMLNISDYYAHNQQQNAQTILDLPFVPHDTTTATTTTTRNQPISTIDVMNASTTGTGQQRIQFDTYATLPSIVLPSSLQTPSLHVDYDFELQNAIELNDVHTHNTNIRTQAHNALINASKQQIKHQFHQLQVSLANDYYKQHNKQQRLKNIQQQGQDQNDTIDNMIDTSLQLDFSTPQSTPQKGGHIRTPGLGIVDGSDNSSSSATTQDLLAADDALQYSLLDALGHLEHIDKYIGALDNHPDLDLSHQQQQQQHIQQGQQQHDASISDYTSGLGQMDTLEPLPDNYEFDTPHDMVYPDNTTTTTALNQQLPESSSIDSADLTIFSPGLEPSPTRLYLDSITRGTDTHEKADAQHDIVLSLIKAVEQTLSSSQQQLTVQSVLEHKMLLLLKDDGIQTISSLPSSSRKSSAALSALKTAESKARQEHIADISELFFYILHLYRSGVLILTQHSAYSPIVITFPDDSKPLSAQ